ncbi:MraY family glycosyltransferase [Bosea sp. 117]|uniref:MraY family glycosyltransferase n=1 Tax=Bosea sp. 117 TaxID=1125973 RepID=UPI00068C212F|nr:MraY family glycosyltransferase [Bosea sp. 117]
MLTYALAPLSALLLSAALIAGFERIAIPAGLVDRPTARKVHIGNVPVVGGLAMFLAFLAVGLPAGAVPGGHWELAAALAVLVGLGVIDDRIDLGARTKLAVQIFAALLMTAPNRHVLDLGFLFPGLPGFALALAWPVSVVFIVGLINAFNMIDGLDGLAGGLAASALGWLAFIAGAQDRPGECLTLLILLAATLGFLAFNMRHPWCGRARVFMGDAGSMMLGAAIAYFIIVLGEPGPATPGHHWPFLLWLAAIPVIDTASLIVRRLLAGRSPFSADRWHLHHLLLAQGLSVPAICLLLVGLSVLMGAIGVAGPGLNLPALGMLVALVVPAAVHTAFVTREAWIGALHHGRPVRAAAVPSAPVSERK